MGILQHHSQGPAQIRLLDLVDIDTVVADFSVGDIIEPVDQIGDGGLSGTGGAYESDLLPRLCPQADIVQNNLVVRIAKVHIIEDHTALLFRIGDGSFRLVGMFPCPQVGTGIRLGEIAVFVLSGVYQFHIALVLFRLLIHQIEHTLGACRGVDHEVDLLAHLGDGVGKALVQSHEGYDGSDGDSRQLIDSQDGSHDGHQRVADPSDVGVDRHQQVGVGIGLVGAVSQLLIYLSEILHSFLLMAEYFYHFLAVQHFLDKSVHRAQINLLADVILSGQSGKSGGDKQHHECSQDGNHRQGRTENQHGHQGCRHGNHRVDNLRNTLAQ